MRNYDVTTFTWDGGIDGGVDVEGSPDLHQLYQTMRAYADSVPDEPKKIAFVRPTKLDKDLPRPTYRVPYGLDDKQREWLESTFRGWNFSYEGNKHHDHPLSHLARELNEMEMVADLEGKRYIDLFGNPGRARRWGRRCVVLTQLCTAKDYIRHNKDKGTTLDWEKLWSGGYNDCGVTCLTHALYYLSLEKLARLAARGEVRALVHRHDKTHGFLNNGEQEYWVNREGIVTQVNVETGEKYSHPTLEPFFHQSSAKTAAGGLTWTITKLGGDTYMFTFAHCPIELAGDWVPLDKMVRQTGKVTVANDVTVHEFLGWTWYTKSNASGPVELTDVELMDKLRRYIACRPRTARNWENLSNHARRNCNKFDVISLHGGGGHTIDPALLSDYVNAAFYMDVRHELESAISHVRDNTVMTKALNSYYENGVIPANLSIITKTVEAMAQVGSYSKRALREMKKPRAVVDTAPPPAYGDWAPKTRVFPPMPRPTGVPLDKGLVDSASRDEMWSAAWKSAIHD